MNAAQRDAASSGWVEGWGQLLTPSGAGKAAHTKLKARSLGGLPDPPLWCGQPDSGRFALRMHGAALCSSGVSSIPYLRWAGFFKKIALHEMSEEEVQSDDS